MRLGEDDVLAAKTVMHGQATGRSTNLSRIVFDLQQALLLWMTGAEPEDEELENAN